MVTGPNGDPKTARSSLWRSGRKLKEVRMATPLPDSEYEEIDPLVDPARANAIGTAVMSGAAFVPRDDAPPPVIEEPPDDVVHLPGGYLDRKGAVHSTVRIRELTGADEEELAKPAARRTAWHLV